MSDQVHKTLLACDGLNRTGQQAPASHGLSDRQKMISEAIARSKETEEMVSRLYDFALLIKVT